MQSLVNQSFSWTKKWAKSRFSLLVIFMFLFLDASIFPLPTTIAFITFSLIHPSRSYYNALVALMGMVLGSIVGYAIGHYLWLLPNGDFTKLAQYLFAHIPNFNEVSYQHAQSIFQKWNYSILFLSIILPIPYQFISTLAGVFDFDIYVFTISTMILQGFRFFLLAWLVIRYGEGVKTLFKENLKIITIVSILLLITTFIITLI
jgi:membrane protein YqaA with SNARE-associated domain